MKIRSSELLLEAWASLVAQRVKNPSTCKARDPHSIPESGRSLGECISHPFQCSWASLVVQSAKDPPAMWETWVRSLGWEDLLEEGIATHPSIPG